MVFFNYATMQMAAKIVYYGPGLCGKTTNLHHIYGRTAPDSRGEMVSLETETDRTLFFDLLPLDVGVISGFKTDDGESGSADGNTYIPTTAAYFDGRTGAEMRNGYSAEYHKAVWSVLGTNGILFARSGFTGSRAYPAAWAGDNEPNFGDANGLPSVVGWRYVPLPTA